MAQTTTTTSGPSNIDVGNTLARINNLRAIIATGNSITASAITELASIYNAIVNHNHTVYDYGFIAYGNLGYTTWGSTNTSSIIKNASYASGVGQSSKVTAADHNSLASLVNSILWHTHTIDDTIG